MQKRSSSAKKASAKKKLPATYKGKSTKLGQGGRAQMLKDQGVPGGVIGEIARKKHAAPGQKFYKGNTQK